MLDHLIFIFYLFFFLISTIGYGIKFTNHINPYLKDLNYGWYGLIGFFVISLISLITSFFIPHNSLHNICIHSFGIFFFYKFIRQNNNFFELRLLLLITVCLLIGAYVYKNHDDFSYYHLTYALNLTENSFIVGTGNFSHGFRTFSSLFYYHSILFMPYIKFYLFHIGPFFILIFFNYILIQNLISKHKSKSSNFLYFFSLLGLIFINIVFYRIGEHGTDRSAQILLLIIFLLFIEVYYFEENKEKILKFLSLMIITITFAASMKAIYYMYFLLLPIIFYKKKLFYLISEKKNFLFIFIITLSVSINFLTYQLNTGCFLYPAAKTCLIDTKWSIPKDEVKELAIHYEWWAKAGGGPGYSHELEKKEYVKNFNWLSNWIDKHFFNKVSDTLLGTILICLIVFIFFTKYKIRKKKLKKNISSFLYLILAIFFLEWFLNHPSMRYGGYILIGLPLIIFTSSLLSKIELNKVNSHKLAISFVILSLVIFNLRNINRINKEIDIYNYDISNSPYFYIPDVKTKIIAEDKNFKIFQPIGNSCWAAKTPCTYNSELKIDKFLWMNMVYRK